MQSMLSEAERVSLSDILTNIDFAQNFVEGLDYEAFLTDTRTFYAVTRCLEIISEASRRLSPAMKERHPSIAWSKIAGAGNIYRHDYEDVAHRLVWGTVHEFLSPLRVVINQELSRRCRNGPAPELTSRAGLFQSGGTTRARTVRVRPSGGRSWNIMLGSTYRWS